MYVATLTFLFISNFYDVMFYKCIECMCVCMCMLCVVCYIHVITHQYVLVK